MRKNHAIPRGQAGFSLIEIMIVIVLIGGIVALVTNRVMNSKDSANARLTGIQLTELAAKIDQFRSDTGKLPESLDQLVTSPGLPGWLGPYVPQAQLTDQFGGPIEYKRPGQNGPYEVISLGSDGAVGGESFAADIRKP
jgi:general secretion pathway protein G